MTADFSLDSPIAEGFVASPNFGERRGRTAADMIVLHYTGMENAAGALSWLANPAAQVSAHYFVAEDGTVIQMVGEAYRAWHAGVSAWGGDADINSASIGIEIVNPGHEFGYRPFPEVQIAAVVALCRDIVDRLGILPERVLGHSDVAPGRKTDPGELFPWALLAREGIGHFVEPEPIGSDRGLAIGDEGDAVADLQGLLRRYGYRFEAIEGVYCAKTEKTVAAFQRHFRPARVDGIGDFSTMATLARLIEGLAKTV